jgi:hypothetical protein
MDRFFTQKCCDRCYKDLKDGRTMSMFNEDCICMDCASKEVEEEGYDKAVEADHEEIRKGNFNYKGIGRGTEK